MAILGPLDYRYALDVAASHYVPDVQPLVICNIPELWQEINNRLPSDSEPCSPTAALWVEPLIENWMADLAVIAQRLQHGGTIAVIASQPLARVIPERRSWPGSALGLRPRGIGQLINAMPRVGFRVSARYGFHTPAAIGFNMLSRQLERWGRPDLGDRAHFAARLRYVTSGPLSTTLATVTLITATREC
jgi:hypothetical protein